MAPHSSILAWRIPWTEKPGRLQSTGSQRVGQNRATSLFTIHYGPIPQFAPDAAYVCKSTCLETQGILEDILPSCMQL